MFVVSKTTINFGRTHHNTIQRASRTTFITRQRSKKNGRGTIATTKRRTIYRHRHANANRRQVFSLQPPHFLHEPLTTSSPPRLRRAAMICCACSASALNSGRACALGAGPTPAPPAPPAAPPSVCSCTRVAFVRARACVRACECVGVSVSSSHASDNKTSPTQMPCDRFAESVVMMLLPP